MRDREQIGREHVVPAVCCWCSAGGKAFVASSRHLIDVRWNGRARSLFFMTPKRVVIVGATGMVGGEALKLALAHPLVSAVTVVGRRSCGVTSPELKELLHEDFGDCSPLAATLANQDVALYCLGAYTGTLPDEEFRKVTVDYTSAFARALHAASPGAAFCFLSGAGADPTERSRMAFARYKGAAEKSLLATGFARVHIFRPGYIYPVEQRREPSAMYRVSRALYPVLRGVMPSVRSDELARVMLDVGLNGPGADAAPVLENRDIRALGQRSGSAS